MVRRDCRHPGSRLPRRADREHRASSLRGLRPYSQRRKQSAAIRSLMEGRNDHFAEFYPVCGRHGIGGMQHSGKPASDIRPGAYTWHIGNHDRQFATPELTLGYRDLDVAFVPVVANGQLLQSDAVDKTAITSRMLFGPWAIQCEYRFGQRSPWDVFLDRRRGPKFSDGLCTSAVRYAGKANAKCARDYIALNNQLDGGHLNARDALHPRRREQ